MKKNTIKAFTLVEMLIVIVIIGILIASLMPRMQSAQGRARDVARKNDLAQIQSAIITSQQDRGEWPGDEMGATGGISISSIEDQLLRAGMSSIPTDPNKANVISGLGANSGYVAGQYGYMIAKRNGIEKGGFVLMAKTEVEGGSNWLYCGSGTSLDDGQIASSQDLKDITVCSSFDFDENGDCSTTVSGGNKGECKYNSVNQLRYILLY